MPGFPPDFLAQLPYSEEGFLLDDLLEVDREARRIRVGLNTQKPLPLQDTQRTHPVLHPPHIPGSLLVHLTGMAGMVYAHHIAGVRFAEGWIGYGVKIYSAEFRQLARLGPPLEIECTELRRTQVQGKLFTRCEFVFHQEEQVVYRGDQLATWFQPEA